MEYHKAIIIGSGPAGAACAWKIRASGVDCILLDKQPFPRQKVCAGWIAPEVMQHLEFKPEDYPHSTITFNSIITHIYGLTIPIKTEQYSIRRVEFDDWLSKRSGAAVHLHKVKHIRKNNGQFIIDDSYRCQYLVGAAGTACPVFRTFFVESHPREKRHLIIALEDEFQYDFKEKRCHLWFFKHKLPGYAWYVPKGDGYLNIGIGGLGEKMGAKGKTIKQYWDQFIRQLEFQELMTN
ncbi:MAG: NAD(P)-binding protein, partial [Simkaniaceae bacterium]|nr:NAD(P)-binding protein [Simkaniaceae bacterium]